MSTKFVTAIEKSQNKKTGNVSATYAPIQSCPKTCPFLDHGCYAQSGPTGWTLNRLNRNCKTNSSVEIAKEEAKEIRGLTGKRDLRLHVVGDARSRKAVEILAAAAKDHIAKANKKVWTYTHAWREVPRESWGDVSVIASCETFEDIELARTRGYATSMVISDDFMGTKKHGKLTLVACPGITEGKTCETCRICMNDKKIKESNKVVCFFPHGAGLNKAKKALEALK